MCRLGQWSGPNLGRDTLEGVCLALGRVRITHEADWMAPWLLTDEEERIALTLTPTYDRTTRTKLLFIDNECHQVFGRFDGFAVLDDGRKLDISELYAFAEHAVNNW